MKKKKVKFSIIVVLGFLLFSLINISFTDMKVTALVASDSIDVASDADFIIYGFPGSGTEADPYRIENYAISSTDINDEGIRVKNTTKYFIIQNCEITSSFYGILVEEVAPDTGKIMNNYCYSNKHDGIGVKEASGVEISGNIVEKSVYATGASIENCTSLLIINNIFQKNPKSGIGIYYSSGFTITENIFRENKYKGITAASTKDCTIYRNHFELNEEFGLEFIQDSSNNVIYHNNFVDNAPYQKSQSRDTTGNSLWYNTELLEGNYWNDYSGSGIYSIDGSSGCCDMYPLKKSVNLDGVDQTNFSYLLITLISLPLVYYFRKKREDT